MVVLAGEEAGSPRWADDEHETSDAYDGVLAVAFGGRVRGAVNSGARAKGGASFPAEVTE